MKIKTTLGKFLNEVKDQSQEYSLTLTANPSAELNVTIVCDDTQKSIDLTDAVKPTLPHNVARVFEAYIGTPTNPISTKITAADLTAMLGRDDFNVEFWARQHKTQLYLAALVGYETSNDDARYFLMPVCDKYLMKDSFGYKLIDPWKEHECLTFADVIFSKDEVNKIDLGSLGTPTLISLNEWLSFENAGFNIQKVGEIDG